MFDSIFEYIIIFIPIAIFIGRMVSKYRHKNQAPPPKIPQPDISVHFEDDDYHDDYDEDYRDDEHINKEPVKNIPPAWSPPLAPAVSVNLAEKTPVSIPVLPRQKDFVFNLNHLSPLKQAVVMAEILGPPKGLI